MHKQENNFRKPEAQFILAKTNKLTFSLIKNKQVDNSRKKRNY